MTTFTCLLATLLAVLSIPVAVLFWLTESKHQKARRWRNSGMKYAEIARRLHCSPTTAKRWSQPQAA